MASLAVRFILNLAVVQRPGLTSSQESAAAFAGAILGPPLLGIFVASAIASSEAPPSGGPATVNTLSAGGAALSGGTPALAIAPPTPATPPTPPAGFIAAPTTMISFHGFDRTQAESFASWLGLKPPQFEGTGRVVEHQEPGIGKPMPADLNLKLRLGGK